MKSKMDHVSVIRDIPVAGIHGLQRQAPPEKRKAAGPLLRCASCPCFGASGTRQVLHNPSPVLVKTHSAVFHQDHYRHPLASKPSLQVVSNSRSYYRNEALMAPEKQDTASSKVMQHISNVFGPCCPCPAKCGPCCGPSCGPCNCSLPAPCNTPPRCVQYMTGYYYYPYGFWFCGPYHVTGTCVPGGPVAPGGPCGPCAPNPGGPCGPCNPACVCGVFNSLAVMPTSDQGSKNTINLMPSEQAMNMLDVTKIKLPFDMSSLPMSCLPLSPTKGGGPNLPPLAGPCSACGPCCGPCCCGGPSAGGCGAPCAPCCGGCGPCGPCGPKGPFGPCGPCFPGVGCGCGGFGGCGSSAQCCMGPGCGCAGGCGGMCVGPCGSCGPFCGNCGPCGCGCGPCGPCCGPCGPCCGPCGPCGPCCGPCGPLTGPCGCGACGRGPCGCGACLPFGCGACFGVGSPGAPMPCPSPSPPSPATVSGLPPPPPASGQWTGPCINCKCSQPIPINPASLGSNPGPGPFTQCCLAITDAEEDEDAEVCPKWNSVEQSLPARKTEGANVLTAPTDILAAPTDILAAPKKAVNPVQLLNRPGSNLTVFHRRPGYNETKQVNDPNKPLVNSIFTCYQSTMSGDPSSRSGRNMSASVRLLSTNSSARKTQSKAEKFPTIHNPRFCTPIVEREMPSFPNCFTYLNAHPRCALKPSEAKAKAHNRIRDLKSQWPISCK